MSALKAPTPDAISEACALLQAGEVIGLPTETVYGLAADASNGQAIAKIYALKDRPSFNPLIVHFADADAASRHVAFNDWADRLATAFWPGPLTMVLPRLPGSNISELATAGLDTIAVRCPDHKVAHDVLAGCNLPIAAPSANPSGYLSPTAPQHVATAFAEKLPLILAGGPAKIGLESTVIDLTRDQPALLRHGAIAIADMEAVLECPILDATQLSHGDAPRSPGQILRHYAPRLPVRLKAVDVDADEALLAFGPMTFMGIKGGGHAKDLPAARLRNLSEKGDLYEAAANLFSYMRALEDSGASRIAVMDIPAHGIGLAIRDRLEKAANAAKG
jgi:L-threonylcarbamoyladenylate synthase